MPLGAGSGGVGWRRGQAVPVSTVSDTDTGLDGTSRDIIVLGRIRGQTPEKRARTNSAAPIKLRWRGTNIERVLMCFTSGRAQRTLKPIPN